jgi:hypothetical protein
MAKKAAKKKAAKKAIGSKASTLKPSLSRPPTWYFPTGDPGMVMACDWNEDDKQYDKNCREIPAPQHISAAIKKSIKIAAKAK